MKIAIVAPHTAWNSLTRAFVLAEMARHLGEVRVLAGDDGELWPGAANFPFGVEPFDAPGGLAAALRDEDVVIASKASPRSLGAARRALGGRRLVVDVDDDDAAIDRMHFHGPRQLTWFYARHPMAPWRVRARLGRALREASLLTVTSRALRGRLPRSRAPELAIGQPRPPRDYAPPAPAERLRVGFLGTAQRYKGVDAVVALVAARPGAELHIYAGTRLPAAADELRTQGRLVEHPQGDPGALERAHAQVDLVVLPQRLDDLASRHQLPIKLLDALSFGRPVIASATPAILEVAGDVVLPVTSWDSLDQAQRHLEALSDPGARLEAGRRGHAYFRERLASDVVARRFAAALSSA